MKILSVLIGLRHGKRRQLFTDKCCAVQEAQGKFFRPTRGQVMLFKAPSPFSVKRKAAKRSVRSSLCKGKKLRKAVRYLLLQPFAAAGGFAEIAEYTCIRQAV